MHGDRLNRDGAKRVAPFVLAAVASLALLASAAPAHAFDRVEEALNYAKIAERQAHITLQPEFQAALLEQNARDQIEYREIAREDPERDFGENLCGHRKLECIGDVRFYDWAERAEGIMRPVLFGARNGATLSGTLWASREGPRKRAAVVITTGGLAPETLYWGFAAQLARHGYVVLTYDVQGQGRSDTYGEEPDRMEGRTGGFQLFASGQPFLDGTEDALDFLLSKPRRPHRPRRSCGNANDGVASSHAAKHLRRVSEGRNEAYNPLWRQVDSDRVGLAGHSQGAFGVSYVGQRDPRVKAVVAWDNLRRPVEPRGECPARPKTRRDLPIRKPGLGISADYHQPPVSYRETPDPLKNNQAFIAYRRAGVDSMQLNIRGGTHYEFSFMPGYALTYPFGTASLRGYDLVGWYTTAWLDRYVKCRAVRCERRATRRLLSDRWLDDRRGGEVDPKGDANLLSFYLRSSYALRRPNGKRLRCADMRSRCPQMRPDRLAPPDFDLVDDAMTPRRR